jgi:hypothetical protein
MIENSGIFTVKIPESKHPKAMPPDRGHPSVRKAVFKN